MPYRKMIAASALTGTIYSGTVNPDKGVWVGKKTDVTDQVVRAMADHMNTRGKDYCFETRDGKFAVIRFTMHNEMPEDFAAFAAKDGDQ